jgi:hypothetical protein
LDALLTIAQIALGFAGFTGVASAFRSPQTWGLHESFRLARMLDSSLYALLLALVPPGLTGAGLSPVATWRLASALFAAALLFRLWRAFAAMRVLPAGARAQLNHLAARVIQSTNVLMAVLLALNSMGVFWDPGFAVYYLGLLCLIAIAAFQFTQFLLAGRSEA